MPSSDNLGTVRDIAEYDDVSDTTTIVDHYVYDAFGNETTGTLDFRFAYTGRAFDEETGLQNNLNRWYDPVVGRWLSEDPIGFAAGDANVYRYVGNAATGFVDPDGLIGFYIGSLISAGVSKVAPGSYADAYAQTMTAAAKRVDPIAGVVSSYQDVYTATKNGGVVNGAGVAAHRYLSNGHVTAPTARAISGAMDMRANLKNGDSLPTAYGKAAAKNAPVSGSAVNAAEVATGKHIGGEKDGQPLTHDELVDKAGGVVADAANAAGGAIISLRAGSRPCRSGPSDSLTAADRARIQRFADEHGTDVNVVGSRASGKAGPKSDYDYILGRDGGNSRLRQKARRELPRGTAGGEIHPRHGETGIDVFKDSLDTSRPHITFKPKPKEQ